MAANTIYRHSQLNPVVYFSAGVNPGFKNGGSSLAELQLNTIALPLQTKLQ